MAPKAFPNNRNPNLDDLRPFSEIRLVVLDLDGTLVESNNSVFPKKISELANSLKSNKYGVRMTLATGRTLSGARQMLENLPILNDTPIILYNGSVILNKRFDILDRKIIPIKALWRIIRLVSRFNVKTISYVCDVLGGSGPQEYAQGWSNIDKPDFEFNKMRVDWLDWADVKSARAPSAVVIHTTGQPKAMCKLARELSKIDDISCTHGGTSYIEVRPRNSNKGIALEYVAGSLNLKREQILAIGDNDNDFEMLSWAGIGVAVNSASKRAIECSDYVTCRGVLGGAIEALKCLRDAIRLSKNK